MRHFAILLALACVLVVLVNEGIRIKYGFISNRHFMLFWLVWALVLVGFGISLGLLLSDVIFDRNPLVRSTRYPNPLVARL